MQNVSKFYQPPSDTDSW